jgi:xanthine dehydrogenase YagS FAD-binding subunit
MMNRFQWMNAATIAEAAGQTNSTVADAMFAAGVRTATPAGASVRGTLPSNATIIKAGGIDLLDLLKEGLVTPAQIINIRTLPNLDRLTNDSNAGLRIGSLVTLAQIAADTTLQRTHTALTDAASHVATPQIRNAATLGGNLLQRPKCWYFRNEAFRCLKKGGDRCFAPEGDNEFHAIFGNQTCPFVHPSTMATPLVAMNAELVLTNPRGSRTVRLEEFFVTPEQDVRRENSLQSGEIITEIRVPAMSANTRSAHIKQGEKESFDWAIVDVAVVLEQAQGRVNRASIVLGAVAPVPWRARAAEAALINQPVNEETARAAARAAVQGATPLSGNGHKVPITEAVVRRAILQAARGGE